jgi:ribosomal protein L14
MRTGGQNATHSAKRFLLALHGREEAHWVSRRSSIAAVTIGGLYAGSAIAGPVAKECADIWPRIASAANCIV